MTTPTLPGVVPVRADQADRLVADHPELQEDGVSAPVLLVTAARNSSEAADLAGLIAVLHAHLRRQTLSAAEIVRALLPADGLTLGPGMLNQLHRNAAAQRELAEQFGLLTSADVAELAGSRATNAFSTAHRWRRDRRVFAVEADGTMLYPGFQFAPNGKPLPLIAELIDALGDVLDPWELALWFTSANSRLGNVRPVDVLNGSDEDRAAVLQAATETADELTP